MSSELLPLRPNVCLFILNKDNLVFMGERLGSSGVWQLPQGGIEEGASLQDNALREASEETGASLINFKVEHILNAIHEYEFAKPREYEVENVQTKSKRTEIWRGQRQNFAILRYMGTDKDFVLDRYEAEFSDWCWVKLEDLLYKAEPRRAAGYRNALQELMKILSQADK